MEKKILTLGSLFDGIGGFPLAGSRKGFQVLWASEIEAFPVQVTRERFPDMMHAGDITLIHGARLPPVDLITGGSPCQDLSIAGKRAGLAGSRSGLFMEQVRIVKEMREEERKHGRTAEFIRPRFMCWENVPGALSSTEGEDFRAVLEEICKIEYPGLSVPRPPNGVWLSVGTILGDQFSLAWRILDAQYWGVPQRRRRIFLVADFGGTSAPKILFDQGSLPGYPPEMQCEREQPAGDAGEGTEDPGRESPLIFENQRSDARYRGPLNVAPTITAKCGTGGGNLPLAMNQTRERVEQPVSYCIAGNTIERAAKNGGNGTGVKENVAYTLNTMDRHAVFDAAQLHSCYQTTVGALCKDDEKGIGNQYVSQDKCVIGEENLVRRLTPLECERLMGYPDGWTLVGKASDSARYKALGNSVAIPCVEYVMQGIALVLQHMYEK